MFKPMKKYQKAAAFAAAFVLAATTFAASPTKWFDAGISSLTAWPATGWSSSAEGTAPVASMATINAGALEIDTSDAELQYGVEAVGLTYAPLVISSTQKFTPAAADTELPDPADAKGGLAVVKTGDTTYAYYGIVKVDTANAWVALAGATPSDPANAEVATTITISNDAGNAKIAYAVGGVALTYSDATTYPIDNIVVGAPVSKVAYAGCGVVSALSGTKVVPEYAITIKPGANLEIDKVTVGGVEQTGVGGVYTLPLGAEYTITFVATSADFEVTGSPIIGTVAGEATVDTSSVVATEKTYYVTYKANEGTGEDVKQGYKKSDTTAPVAKAVGTGEGECAFARLGYTFAGWNTEADGSGTAYAAGADLDQTSGSYELFAQWTIVNYDIAVVGGEADAPTYTVAGATVNLTKGAIDEGKEFKSWTADPAAGVSFDGDVMTIAANTTGKITVTCNSDWADYTIKTDHCTVNPETYTYEGAAISVTADPAGNGYAFKDWTVSVGTVVDNVWTIPAGRTGEQTIKANYEMATYTIVIDANGGEKTAADPTYQISESALDRTLTKPTAPANKEFDAWVLTDKTGVSMDGDVVKIAAGVFGTINVKATWKEAAPVGPVIDPTQGETEAKDVVAESDTAAAAKVIAAIKAPVVAGMELTDAAYQGYFTATAVQASSGKENAYDVTLALNPTAVAPEETLKAAAAAVVSGAAEAAVTNAKPGLFYSFKYSGDVTAVTTEAALEGARVQATSTSVTIPVPQDATANVRFWVLNVSTVDNKLGD